MKNQAFTLIEVLVVVLIIGILAAIALPKYQYAVLKTRYNNLKPITTSIFRAAQAYELANNKWPSSIDELDVSIPANVLCNINSSSLSKNVICYFDDHTTMGYLVYDNNYRYCIVYVGADNEHKLCQEETNQTKRDSGWYMYPSTI